MSGVRNLRAMFENKGESNPPDRGRSPGPGGYSVGSPSPSHSPRPLSKVRTTFVAVEKDGRVGLRREPSGDSVSASSRRLSNETEATTPQPAPEKTDIFAENMAKNAAAFKTNLSQEAIPESPVQNVPETVPSKQDDESSNIAPNPNPDKVVDEEETKTKLLPGNPTEKSAVRGKSVTPTPSVGSQTNGKPKTTAATKPAPKAAPISTSAKSVSKAQKSPNTARPVTSTTRPSASATNLAPKKATPAASKDHDAPKKTTAPVAKTATGGKKPAPVNLPPSGPALVKPKPKSPTRPINLPPSLTAPTAAYAGKLGGNATHPPRQSLSRASGNAQHLNVGSSSTTHRSPSRNSAPTTGTVSNTKSLKRQSSTISRPRPSIGPPPKQTARDHSVAKKEGNVDESFLARMMRPTQASSSKTSEKAPITPPRKQSTPATAHRKPLPKDAEANAKKAATKIQASTNKLKAAVESAKPAGKAAPTAKEVAPVVAQAETAEAAIETAKVSTETAATSVAETQKATTQPISTEEIKQENTEPEVTVPAITEDPQKVEDIEDLVQEAVEQPADQDASEPATEVSEAVEEPKEAESVEIVAEAADELAETEVEAAGATEELEAKEEQPSTTEDHAEAEVKSEGEVVKVEGVEEHGVPSTDV
ncbi:hypothetical protein M426DRAFT_192788 [Hypoxylon sp. CI-4A]|nr:hypothetical protein M426DRAFT_192788 [Hypoxylon sp. CI-4A]